LEDLGVYGGCY